MFIRKSGDPPNASNGSPCSIQNPDGEIFGSPSYRPRDFNAQRQAVPLSGCEKPPSKPVEIYRKDGPHAREPTEESNVLKKLEAVKLWSVNTLKCTKQVIEEKLGTAVPTCDEKLDLRIQTLIQMQKQYRLLLDSIRQFSSNLSKTVQSQRELAGQLTALGQQQLELSETFTHNAETQKFLVLNGEKLLCALDVVTSGLSTLVHQTFDDTMLTIRHMNMARIEFDAYRKENDAVRAASATAGKSNDSSHDRRAEQVSARFSESEENFIQLKAAVDAKLRLLHENRLRVMQHHLLLLHNATSAYSSGNVAMMDQTLKQFNVKLTSPVKNAQSILPNYTSRQSGRKQPSRKSMNGTS